MGPWGPFGSFQGKKRAILGQIRKKIKIFQLFKTCFSPVGLQNIKDIQRKKKIITKISKKGVQKLQKRLFLPKKARFLTEWPERHKFGLQLILQGVPRPQSPLGEPKLETSAVNLMRGLRIHFLNLNYAKNDDSHPTFTVFFSHLGAITKQLASREKIQNLINIATHSFL